MFTNLKHFIPGKGFGHCLKEPPETVKLGEQVSATFVSGLTILSKKYLNIKSHYYNMKQNTIMYLVSMQPIQNQVT